MDDILKGNYKIHDTKTGAESTENKEKTLEDEFEAAVQKKLGGSVTYVKRRGPSFSRGGKKDE